MQLTSPEHLDFRDGYGRNSSMSEHTLMLGSFWEEDGDTYQDGNGNGQFNPVWIAGFQNQRPAQGIHDELWARTMVIDDGSFRLAYVVLDAIGYFNDDVISIRKKVSEDAGFELKEICEPVIVKADGSCTTPEIDIIQLASLPGDTAVPLTVKLNGPGVDPVNDPDMSSSI